MATRYERELEEKIRRMEQKKDGFGKRAAKGAGIIAAAGLGGLALGLRYDPNKKWSLFK
jgi:hypothetical protein